MMNTTDVALTEDATELTEGMNGVCELEKLVRDYGFIGAHSYPHWFELAPDHARYYPFYAKCVELDIPIQLQVGQSMVYDTSYPRRSVGRPTYWPESFVKFINSFGPDKVLFGTDFPVLPFEQTRADIEALGLKPVALRKLLRDNAARRYKL